MNAEVEYKNDVSQAAKKDIPYSASRVYLPEEKTVDGVVFNRLPSGREYVRMPDGNLRRVKDVKRMADGSIGVKV